MAFTGQHQHTLDTKGRVILPSAFRERLSGGLVFAPSQDRCINVYPAAAYDRMLEVLRAQPSANQTIRNYKRHLLANSYPDTLDSQGRVTIPPKLREYGRLDKNLTINGNDETVQIWDGELWDEYAASTEADFVNFSLDGINL